jgi:CBS domain-containing protein
MPLAAICRRDVVTTEPEATVQRAAHLMREAHVGALIVVRGRKPIGIVTDRDLAMEVLALARSPDTTVGEVMTPYPTTVPSTSGLAHAAALMREHGVRRLPVVDEEGSIFGIVTLDDVLVVLGEELSSLAVAVGHEQVRERRERPPRAARAQEHEKKDAA